MRFTQKNNLKFIIGLLLVIIVLLIVCACLLSEISNQNSR